MKAMQNSLSIAASIFLLSIAYNSSALAQQSGPVYFVVELNVTNQEEFDRDYSGQAGALVTEHGGTFVVGGENAAVVEGTPPEGVVIIVRFDDMERARSFLNSPEYQEIVPVRQRTAETRSYLVHGAAE